MGTPVDGLRRLRDAAASGQLDTFCEELGIDILVAFGSVMDVGAARSPHDLDVAVRLRSDATTDLVDVINALIDLTGTSEVDVLDLERAGVVARARALGPGTIALYEREAGAVAVAQMAALAEAMETAPLRRRDLELLADR